MYIHEHICISPQPGFDDLLSGNLQPSVNNQLHAIEPAYTGIPPGLLRRMGKAVRMGIGAALPIIQKHPQLAGIILGTANGGMEDCIKFLNQIIDYEEGILAPGNFVQSTPNAIAGHLGLMSRNRCYNITHVHRGLAFENALLDALLLCGENASESYLLGGVDEISDYNFNIDFLAGWYKKETVANTALYESRTPGSIAGEGTAMFLVNQQPANALGRIKAVNMLHSSSNTAVTDFIVGFLNTNAIQPDLIITGENGDSRLLPFYHTARNLMPPGTPVARFKHLSGEYPSASAFGLWLAIELLNHPAPSHLLTAPVTQKGYENIILYNCYKGEQHSIIWISKK
ncbi:beta-ketoacyl synthase chain length factor [Terrimonas rubra]|uniref:Beta-ketoacyl synthase chain length factor n=1 Tax=Terrimonas rubra TaxID=1035890 RepID=A0ABW5ZZI1_9BACT